MKNKKKSELSVQMVKAGINPKKEAFFIVVLDLLLLAAAYYSYVLTNALLAPSSILLFLIAIDAMLLGRAKKINKINAESLENEFVHIFSCFKIFLLNGRPVYNALEDCLRYSSSKMEKLITLLLTDIDKDKSVKPYLSFAENFKSLEIRQVMISIYKMSNQGSSPLYFQQFETVFGSLSAEKRKQEVSKYQNSLESMNFLPLADSALTMGLIIIAIITVMGSLTNGF